MHGFSTTSCSTSGPSAPWQYSLATLMGVMLAVAVFCGVWQARPQWALFLAAISAKALATARLARTIRTRRQRVSARLAVATGLCWVCTYVASIGPAVALTQHTMIFDDAVDVAFAPLDWLYRETPLETPLEWYVDYWRRPTRNAKEVVAP